MRRESVLRGSVFALTAVTLSACGGLQWPPPNQQQGTNLSRGSAAVASAPAAKTTHTVVRGDTLIGLSRAHGVDPYEVARLNNLTPPYNIRVNQVLTLPGAPRPASYEIVDRSASPISAPAPRSVAVERVQVDEMKSSTLPAPTGSAATLSAAPVPPPAVQESVPSAREVSAQFSPAGVQPLNVPTEASAAVPARNALPEVAAAPPTTPIERPAEIEPVPEKPQLASLPKSSAKPRGTGRFIWPIEGKLLSEYGSKGDGLHNDGINIAAPKGAPVYAAANGVVAYAGNEIRGFGNLLLIQHADGWMTAYAHNDKLLVKRGDKIVQGQHIAAVGATGNVMSPQLHFEIRRGKRAVDPLDQLGSPTVAQRAS